jgi:hypothetical protein
MRLPIVQPKETASEKTKILFSNIVPGSVVVAQPDEMGATRVYYEGGLYSRSKREDGSYAEPTDEERRQYAMIAAGRLTDRYPTVAFFVMHWENAYDELEEIGYADGRDVKFFGETAK